VSEDILRLSAKQAVDAIDAGELDPAELFALYGGRAKEDKATSGRGGLNCFTWTAEDVPEMPTGPLAGVPLAVKDLFCTEGVPSQSGSLILEGYLPPYTATAVSRLQNAGVTLLAKTNQDEFAQPTARRSTHGIPAAFPAAPPAAAPQRSPRVSRRGRSGPTPVARSVSRPRCAGSSGSNPPTARSPVTG